jgi:hypothetical protein
MIATPGNKTVYREVQSQYDEHGEQIGQNEVTIEVPIKGQEEFMLIFSRVYQGIFQFDGAELKVMIYAGMNAKLNQGLVTFNSHTKKELASFSEVKDAQGKVIKKGLSVGAISNAISSLVKRGVLIWVGKSTYKVNPSYIWKGNITSRNKELQNLKINFTLPVSE